MTRSTTLLLTGLCGILLSGVCFITTASAQLASDTVAFIENPIGVHYVFTTNPSRPGSGVFTYVNTKTGDFDIVGVTIFPNNSFQGASSITGRTATGQIQASSLSVTFNRATRSGPKQATYGPTSRLAGEFFGNITDATAGTGALQGSVSSNGKILLYSFFGNQTILGVGTINTSGDFSIRFTSGLTGTGIFAPINGTAFGSVALSSGFSQAYALTKGVPAKLGNIATRGFIGTGEQILIAGFFVVDGRKGVVITAKGPSLAEAGVMNPLPNPKLQLLSGNQVIASNNDWMTNSNSAELIASGLAPSDTREAALQVTLEAGAYTVQVSSEDTSTGIGLVEVYGVGGPLGN